jgi:hypothetical protein
MQCHELLRSSSQSCTLLRTPQALKPSCMLSRLGIWTRFAKSTKLTFKAMATQSTEHMSGPRKMSLHKDEKGLLYTKLNTGEKSGSLELIRGAEFAKLIYRQVLASDRSPSSTQCTKTRLVFVRGARLCQHQQCAFTFGCGELGVSRSGAPLKCLPQSLRILNISCLLDPSRAEPCGDFVLKSGSIWSVF